MSSRTIDGICSAAFFKEVRAMKNEFQRRIAIEKDISKQWTSLDWFKGELIVDEKIIVSNARSSTSLDQSRVSLASLSDGNKNKQLEVSKDMHKLIDKF